MPVVVIQRPFGTDDYTHIIYSKYICRVGSIQGFYDEITTLDSRNELEFGVYSNYPFGLWLLGSIISKVSGLDVFTTALLAPLSFLVSTILFFYVYSNYFLSSKKHLLLAIGFFLSMPVVSTFLLAYRPSVVVLPLLLLSLYLAFKDEAANQNARLKDIALSVIAVLFVCITHTGSYMFLMLFSIVYTLLYAILSGKLHKGMLTLIVLVLFVYSITISTFPEIKDQYTDKATLLLTASDFITSKTQLTLFSELGNLFYTEIFAQGDAVYAILWSAFFYAFIGLITNFRAFIMSRLSKYSKHNKLNITIPIIGSVNKLPTNVIGAPFWVGPLQSIFLLPGFFKLSKSGRSALLTVLLVTLLPGALSSGATGAIREMYYVLVIVPIVSTLGFYWMIQAILGTAKIRRKETLLRLCFFIVFVSVILVPIVSNLYYLQITAGKNYEITSMAWLGQFGDSNDKSVGLGYRQISTYSDKPIVDYEHGTETRKLMEDLSKIYFYNNTEEYVKDIYYYFGAKYLISSYRVIDNVVSMSGFRGNSKQIYIDSNTDLDKIQSSKDFGIYSAIDYSPGVTTYEKTTGSHVKYDVYPPTLIDKGSVYYVETSRYRVNLDKEKPAIRYLNDNSSGFLEGGYQQDSVLLSWYSGQYKNKYLTNNLDEFDYSGVSVQGNELIYTGYLEDDGGLMWATLIVKYTFYEKTIKKEVILSNDRISFTTSNLLRFEYNTLYGLPVSLFNYGFNNVQEHKKYVYPAVDYVVLKENKFNEVFFDGGDKGLYVFNGENSVYPSEIKYKGSIGELSNYSYVNVKTSGFIQAADSIHIVSYLTIGELNTAKEDVSEYLDVQLSPYPHGKAPVIIIGYLNDFTPSSDVSSLNPVELHSAFKNVDISYSEALPLENEDYYQYDFSYLSLYNLTPLGYLDIYNRSNNLFYTADFQEYKIRNILERAETEGLSVKGLLIDSLNFNLGTIVLANEQGLDFLFTPVPESGLKTPRFAYYNGTELDTLLIPVFQTNPKIENTADFLFSLNNSITQSENSEDIFVFLWRSDVLSDVLQSDGNFTRVMSSFKEGPFYFTNPESISGYMRSLRKLYVNISREGDTRYIRVFNQNEASVNGITFKLAFPRVSQKCSEYLLENAFLERETIAGDVCILYISTDLNAKESKVITVNADSSMNPLFIKLVKGPVEGEIIFCVYDQNNTPVADARVFINEQGYSTDVDGIVKMDLRRGPYRLSIQKTGFETMNYDFEVKSKSSYYLKSIFPWLVLLLLGVLSLFVAIRRRK